ncbi:hypothetical protein CPB84DRAFT_1794465 [Gymnopilus junonius]|uniref:Uncharacterized protein n=1 Tax=Gymnopilus junonius TaxID=109634 RepID=A0A9P5NCF2_GYMJU|nr:hypothetical protein CPB84DRAFT_1794465 [Gymnopilus junonius]
MSPFYSRAATPTGAGAASAGTGANSDDMYNSRPTSQSRSHSQPQSPVHSQAPSRTHSRFASPARTSSMDQEHFQHRASQPSFVASSSTTMGLGPDLEAEEYTLAISSSPNVLSNVPPLSRLSASASSSSRGGGGGQGTSPELGSGSAPGSALGFASKPHLPQSSILRSGSAHPQPQPQFQQDHQRTISSSTTTSVIPRYTTSPVHTSSSTLRATSAASANLESVGAAEAELSARKRNRANMKVEDEVRVKPEPEPELAMPFSSPNVPVKVEPDTGLLEEKQKRLRAQEAPNAISGNSRAVSSYDPSNAMQINRPPLHPASAPLPSPIPAGRPPSSLPPRHPVISTTNSSVSLSSLEEGEVDARSEVDREKARRKEKKRKRLEEQEEEGEVTERERRPPLLLSLPAVPLLDDGVAAAAAAQNLALLSFSPRVPPPASSWSSRPGPPGPSSMLPMKPTTGKIGIKHMELLYKTVGDNWACRMCLTRRQDHVMSASSSSRSSDASGFLLRTVPTCIWDDLLKHCQQEHPEACQDLEKLTPAQVEERKQRMGK